MGIVCHIDALKALVILDQNSLLDSCTFVLVEFADNEIIFTLDEVGLICRFDALNPEREIHAIDEGGVIYTMWRVQPDKRRQDRMHAHILKQQTFLLDTPRYGTAADYKMREPTAAEFQALMDKNESLGCMDFDSIVVFHKSTPELIVVLQKSGAADRVIFEGRL